MKKNTIENVNGTDLLFELELATEGNIDIIEEKTSGIKTVRNDYTLIGEKYVQFATAPNQNSTLYFFYTPIEYKEIGTSGLNEWETKAIEKIVGRIISLEQEYKKLKENKDGYIDKYTFDTYAEAMYKEIKTIKQQMIN